MARKHFEEYYGKIKNQYFQLVDTLEEAGKLVAENMADPQVIENLNNIILPVKNSYMSLAYVEYLLNLPKDKKVKQRNERQFQTLLNRIDKSKQGEAILLENKNTIKELNSVIDEELR